MDTRNILYLAEKYCDHTGLSKSYVGMLAVRDSKFYARLKSGGGCTVRTYNRTVQWFSAHWPDSVAWPADIPRPEPAKDKAA